jgi:glucan endo-1,3-beta-D-glucosidase
MRFSKNLISTLPLAALAAAQLPAQGTVMGFNYGATEADGRCRTYDDYFHYFQDAQKLAGTNGGFASARLYTSIQCGSVNAPIEAFKAAMDTGTKLLLGLWASAGREVYQHELEAILQAKDMWGTDFTNIILGISVGSEDLYRSSAEGQKNKAGVGATGAEIEGYIGWMRDWFRGTPLEGKPIGHVDTWTAWELPENRGVANAVDFLGHNGFPYFESNKPNAIEQASQNFWDALDHTLAVAGNKPVWVTETGWPNRGPTAGQAVPSVQNSEKYWKSVGCTLFHQRNVFWYTLKDANVAQTEMSFAITPNGWGTSPIFDLTC